MLGLSANLTQTVFVYLCICICVFACPTLVNIIFEVLASFPFEKYNTCLVKLQILPKLYLCICVFVFVYLVTPHSHKTNIKKTPVRALQFFRWAALLLLKQQCHGLGPQGLTLCNKLYLCICVFVFVYLVTPHSHKTNIKKMPVRTLQFFRWAVLLLLKQQCHGLGPQGLTLCNN